MGNNSYPARREKYCAVILKRKKVRFGLLATIISSASDGVVMLASCSSTYPSCAKLTTHRDSWATSSRWRCRMAYSGRWRLPAGSYVPAVTARGQWGIEHLASVCT
jgi:hypothetical protein